jgi:hypothetical protein
MAPLSMLRPGAIIFACRWFCVSLASAWFPDIFFSISRAQSAVSLICLHRGYMLLSAASIV